MFITNVRLVLAVASKNVPTLFKKIVVIVAIVERRSLFHTFEFVGHEDVYSISPSICCYQVEKY